MKKILILFLITVSISVAQDVSTNATRPSASDNGYLTAYGYTELELGWFAQEDYWSIPALLKFSPFKKVELGFIMSGIVNHSEFLGQNETDVGDPGVQIKGQVLNIESMAIAVVGRADFYKNSVKKGTIYGAFSFPRKDFQVDITAGGFFGIDSDVIDPGFLWAVAIGSNFEVPTNVYIEFFGENVKDYAPIGFDAGISYKISPDFIIDAAYYTGVNSDALDWQFHVGFTKTLFNLL